ncbi:hypothetical protein M899_2565 [Bacteriovorax sp. BSW11_IV]|uniref:hypothetical protein n=1 Tax=Bacteriovorax sp. BSW11_IV TaxID=1353529 RepID=UPI00038A49C9|nr:hypothetical protein [Bacteriovorax sp. BSW11_IV]EQC50360.1 hypothetical protein M899_2565 [Bacteriovorax sp. BSW11_IV]
MSITRLLILSFLFFAFNTSAESLPRQKFYFKGKVKSDMPKSFKISFLEKYPMSVIKVNDPYQGDKEFSFTGISLCQLFDLFSLDKASSLEVTAINDYVATFTRKECDKSDIYFVYKQDGKYITTELMGPLRIVRANLGVVDKLKLAKEGVYWVWMVQTLEFK